MVDLLLSGTCSTTPGVTTSIVWDIANSYGGDPALWDQGGVIQGATVNPGPDSTWLCPYYQAGSPSLWLATVNVQITQTGLPVKARIGIRGQWAATASMEETGGSAQPLSLSVSGIVGSTSHAQFTVQFAYEDLSGGGVPLLSVATAYAQVSLLGLSA